MVPLISPALTQPFSIAILIPHSQSSSSSFFSFDLNICMLVIKELARRCLISSDLSLGFLGLAKFLTSTVGT